MWLVTFLAGVWNNGHTQDGVGLARPLQSICQSLTKCRLILVFYMEGKSYDDRLRLWTLEERRNRLDLIELFKIFKGLSRVRIADMFTMHKNTKGT